MAYLQAHTATAGEAIRTFFVVFSSEPLRFATLEVKKVLFTLGLPTRYPVAIVAAPDSLPSEFPACRVGETDSAARNDRHPHLRLFSPGSDGSCRAMDVRL